MLVELELLPGMNSEDALEIMRRRGLEVRELILEFSPHHFFKKKNSLTSCEVVLEVAMIFLMVPPAVVLLHPIKM